MIMSWLDLIPKATNLTLNATADFSFDYLWHFALALNQTNPGSSSLYHPHGNQSRICLTYDACVSKVGRGHSYYDRKDVYDRVLLWRVPLIALIATTTLPALVSLAVSGRGFLTVVDSVPGLAYPGFHCSAPNCRSHRYFMEPVL